jgi:RimJ/RimL family protein N-acetyltransferase
MKLETPRLTLQPFTLDDFNDLVQLHADPEVNRFFKLRGSWPEEFVQKCLTGFIKDQKTLGYSKLKVTLKDGTFIGKRQVKPSLATALSVTIGVKATQQSVSKIGEVDF